MPIPFVAPFDGWVQEILRQREEDRLIGVYKNPYAILTSGAKVVKGNVRKTNAERIQDLKNIINSKDPSKDIAQQVYNGCIIANNISNLELSYSTAETPVGIDLDGKIIKVEGERDRRVSTPIIESIEIDTDGANNTTKTARVTLRCFTLKQLELFEMFFMKPGMNVLLEFGDSSILGGLVKKIDKSDEIRNGLTVFRDGEQLKVEPKDRIEELLLPKKGFDGPDGFVSQFGKYFRSSISNAREYFSKIESSLGTYDLFAGKVLDFNFSINDDLTYTVTLEINQSNQISMALPFKPKKKTSSTSTPAKDKTGPYDERDQIIDSLVLNFNLDKDKLKNLLTKKHPEENGDWIRDEFFNYNKVDTTQKDQISSASPYVSLRFILHILMNYVIRDNNLDEKFFEFIIPKFYKKTGKRNEDKVEIEFIPVSSRKRMISASDLIIFPTNELPIMISGEKDGELSVEKSKGLDGTINGYNFHYNGDLFQQETGGNIGNPTGDDRLGNALNIFIKYEEVVRIWGQEIYRIDFLQKILDLMNKNSYGIFSLIYGSIGDAGQPASVIDIKFRTNPNATIIPIKKESTYRFKIGPQYSVVKNFSFNFEMSNLVAGATVFNSNAFLANSIKENKNLIESDSEKAEALKIEDIKLTDEVYKSVDMSSMVNADGYYSINYVEFNTIRTRTLDQANQLKSLEGSTKQQFLSGSLTGNTQVTKEPADVSEIIKERSIKFKFGEQDKTLIYKDAEFIYKLIEEKQADKVKRPTLSPISVNVTLDGFSGFRCGYCFSIDGIPEIYNQNGVFQITNVKHSINATEWTTTLEADYNPRTFN